MARKVRPQHEFLSQRWFDMQAALIASSEVPPARLPNRPVVVEYRVSSTYKLGSQSSHEEQARTSLGSQSSHEEQARTSPESPPPGSVTTYHLSVDRNGVLLAAGPADQADVIIAQDYTTARLIAQGELAPKVALASGKMRISGDTSALLEITEALTCIPGQPLLK